MGDRAHEVAEGLEGVLARYLDPFAMMVPYWDKLPTPLNRRVRGGIDQLNRVIGELIAQGRKRSTEPRPDLLSMLLSARDEDGSGMSDRQLRDEVITLILAGHETTAIALSWTFVLLARHPEVRAKLEEELARVLEGRTPTVADLPKLTYADRIIRESMRLYPPAWSVGREALEDTTVGGHPVQRGEQIWIIQYSLHRDPRFYNEPAQFDPDRWSGDFIKRLPKFAYLPFGGGPRLCIGHAFATMEAVLLLATIARKHRFELVPSHPIEMQPSVTLRPKHGVRAIVRARS
jgi:cytochrome P450